MKKGLTILIIGALLTMIILPQSAVFAKAKDQGLVNLGGINRPTSCKIRHDIKVLGGEFADCPKVGQPASYETQAHCCTVDRILTFIDWFFWALIIISFFMLLIGAFNILTAGGNPDKVALGRKYLMFAVVGLVLALLTFIIPRMVIRIVL